MKQEELIIYWNFFLKDLFLGTFLRVVAMSFLGLALGFAFFAALNGYAIQPREFGKWLEWLILIPGFFWYTAWGIFHGVGSAITYTTQRKLEETVRGLQGLLDLLSRQVLGSISTAHKTFTKEEIAEKFDSLGREFQNNLRLKGLGGWIASILFGIILKGLRFLFLDEIADNLLNKPGNEITTSDIESAIRRVGVNTLLSPIIDQLILIYFLIFVLMVLSWGFPFFLFWII